MANRHVTSNRVWYKRNNYAVKGIYSPYTGFYGTKKNVRQLLKRALAKELEQTYG